MDTSINYQAKHPFNGDKNASQLSFARGDIISSRANQSSANGWLWGTCKGKQGWFPATYVVVQPTSTSMAGDMQQKMQSAVFLPSTQQQQQQQRSKQPAMNNDLLSMSSQSSGLNTASFTGMQSQPTWNQQQQQQQQQGFSQSSFTGLSPQPRMQSFSSPVAPSVENDPFAGLDLAPTPLTAISDAQQQPLPLPMMATSQRTSLGSSTISTSSFTAAANQTAPMMASSSQRTSSSTAASPYTNNQQSVT
eukprot:CAMPEP_0172421978 /NCGR_PEP_ID=MMETSP1064-20121228/8187_1 /TAXON_ID=202472 /ORGANISM="Aulacoseira subarctica , Strain CCAP 1002/5" /LENGTH=248 /DNA_ID=CAMNT_0013162619 /DNA_START=47 /DNA_END=789 /DNA_ORIENTATION=-